ncbi:hypothetical protein JQ760_028170 (plasmid) [Klebsiella pneumoniae]|uniref:hypothetical protein n=1 Tax=Klebsiella pneumoniae TaxID=573 RepID=UPI001FAC80C0|nr:hypothetical protein [Klebsiella pneumoniae]MCI8108461.1 hypothetical protein [Klebsiella pneumoniae]
MSLFLEHVGKIERHYGTDVALRFVRTNDAIAFADASEGDEKAYNVRVEEITALVDVFNAAGGLPDHKLTVERISPKSIRVILNGPNGLLWRSYVFQDDFMFTFVQALTSSLSMA